VVLGSSDLSEFLPPAEVLGEILPSISATCDMKILLEPSDDTIIGIHCHSRNGEILRFMSMADGLGGPIMANVFSSIERLGPLPNLESLLVEHVGWSQITEDDIPTALFSGVLERLSSITSLSLIKCPLHLVELLTITPTSDLCPLLESITLESPEISGESLIALAKSRTNLGPPASPLHERGAYLRNFRVCGSTKVDPKTEMALRELPIGVEIELERDSDEDDEDRGCIDQDAYDQDEYDQDEYDSDDHHEYNDEYYGFQRRR